MENKISLENIEKLFKRWLMEENKTSRKHLRDGAVLKSFIHLMKGCEPASRVYYQYGNGSYYVSLIDFYTYMNEFKTYTDFFTKHFDDFLQEQKLKKQFIYEVNRIQNVSYEGWPERLMANEEINTIEDYVKQRRTTGFMHYVMDSFPWIRAEDTSIQWSRVCSEWRKYIVDILIENTTSDK